MVNTTNILAGVLTLFGGTAGDMLSRVLWFNCSISHPWTMLMVMPPLSIISAIMYFMGKIQAGVNPCSSSFDLFYSIFISIFTIGTFMLLPSLLNDKTSIESEGVKKLIILIVLFIMLLICRTIKSKTICTTASKSWTLTSALTHEAKLAIMSVAVVQFIEFLIPRLMYVPIIGIFARIWVSIGSMIPGATFGVMLAIMHFISNLYDNDPTVLANFCK